MSRFNLQSSPLVGFASIAMSLAAAVASGAHQTSTFSPINLSGSPNYRLDVSQYEFGTAMVPGIHSYATGTVDGKWVLLSGRTNGVHDLDQSGTGSFPAESQNHDVWVIDPVSRQTWHRGLGDPYGGQTDVASGLTPLQIASLSATNNQFDQVGETLYIAGGYGLNPEMQFETFDHFTAIDLPGLVDWVQTGTGTASSHIRQIESPVTSVTGGAMYAVDGRMHLVFGQDFDGPYSPRTDGTYTRQVRSFDVVDDGINLSLANLSESTPQDEYRRRDLNVVPSITADENGNLEPSLIALSGVFTNSLGSWTVPVEIDQLGNPTMADPAAAETFKQGFNTYHSAKLGLYSEYADRLDSVLFGGISVQTVDQATGDVITDNDLPFVNDITTVTRDTDGSYSQQHLGFFPLVTDNSETPWRFGANAEFFLAPGISTYENGVINVDSLEEPTVLGYIYGGIMTNGPHTRGAPDVTSTASHHIFEVLYNPVAIPEPASSFLAFACFSSLFLSRKSRRAQADRIVI